MPGVALISYFGINNYYTEREVGEVGLD